MRIFSFLSLCFLVLSVRLRSSTTKDNRMKLNEYKTREIYSLHLIASLLIFSLHVSLLSFIQPSLYPFASMSLGCGREINLASSRTNLALVCYQSRCTKVKLDDWVLRWPVINCLLLLTPQPRESGNC